MALKYFNVKNGLTAGNITLSAANGNAEAHTFIGNISGTTALFSGNVSLGNVTNVHINGGTAGQVLTTDGLGNLSFAEVKTGPAPMPYLIATGDTVIVPVYYQGLYGMPITVDGALQIDGWLVEV